MQELSAEQEASIRGMSVGLYRKQLREVERATKRHDALKRRGKCEACVLHAAGKRRAKMSLPSFSDVIKFK